jgi:hypothetical protein
MKMAQVQKNTQNTAQAAPAASSEPQNETGSIRSGTSLFALVNAGAGQTVQQKQAFMGDIRQKLAQVADEAQQNGAEAAETEQLAGTCATRLYFARRNGTITGDELTGLLGDVFGYNPKADGTPGKTPSGTGGAIRKRIVRALQGWDFVNGGDGGRFFETMSTDDVAPVINSIGRTKTVMEGDKEVVVPDGPSVWIAYKMLGDLKSRSTVRIEFAFDPKKIAGLTEKLSEAGARDVLLNNPSLVKAYGALFDQLQILSHVDANEEAAIASKLGVVPAETVSDETETTNEGGEELAA